MPRARTGGRDDCKGPCENLEGDGNVGHFDCGSDYMGVYIRQKLLNWVHFIVHKLCLNNADLTRKSVTYEESSDGIVNGWFVKNKLSGRRGTRPFRLGSKDGAKTNAYKL